MCKKIVEKKEMDLENATEEIMDAVERLDNVSRVTELQCNSLVGAEVKQQDESQKPEALGSNVLSKLKTIDSRIRRYSTAIENAVSRL